PAGQPVKLGDPTALNDRKAVLDRYGPLLRHADALRTWLPRPLTEGLTLLEEFAANPLSKPDFLAFNEDLISVTLKGAFLPFEDVYATVQTSRGTRVGPVQLTGTIPPLGKFASRAELLAGLHQLRDSPTDVPSVGLQARITLPPSVAPN